MNVVNYKKLINPILKYYIQDAVDTKKQIIYKIEYDKNSNVNKYEIRKNN